MCTYSADPVSILSALGIDNQRCGHYSGTSLWAGKFLFYWRTVLGLHVKPQKSALCSVCGAAKAGHMGAALTLGHLALGTWRVEKDSSTRLPRTCFL